MEKAPPNGAGERFPMWPADATPRRARQPSSTCDAPTRRWCARVTLLALVVAALAAMLLSAWTYYAGLVGEMDALASAEPYPLMMVDLCGNSSWNARRTAAHNWTLASSSSSGGAGQTPRRSDLFLQLDGRARDWSWSDSGVLSVLGVGEETCYRFVLWRVP